MTISPRAREFMTEHFVRAISYYVMGDRQNATVSMLVAIEVLRAAERENSPGGSA